MDIEQEQPEDTAPAELKGQALLDHLRQHTTARTAVENLVDEGSLFEYYTDPNRIRHFLDSQSKFGASSLVLRFWKKEELAVRVHEAYLAQELPCTLEHNDTGVVIVFRW